MGCDSVLPTGTEAGGEQNIVISRDSDRDAATLIVGRAADAHSLDPAIPSDSDSMEIIAQIYDRLLYYRAGTGELAPGLATGWSLSEDGRQWTLSLRRGVRFHDGSPFDADAVVFSLERQRKVNHPFYREDFSYRHHFRSIESVEKLDDFTVRITIERQYTPFLATMAILAAAIVSPQAVRRAGDAHAAHPVGTGPFSLVSWSRGNRIVLERNPDYWGEAPAFRRLVFEVIPDPRQRLVALESGSIDIAHAIAPEDVPLVALHPGLVLHRTTAPTVTYLALHTDRPPFDDIRVRRAVNHAINKGPIVKVLWQGAAVPADGPLPPTMWGHHAAGHYGYDLLRARALLAEAQAEGRIRLDRVYTLHVTSTPRPYLPSPERLGRAVQANLAEVGIATRLVVLPFAEHRRALRNGLHHLAVHGWGADNDDPDNVLYTLFDRDNTEPGHASNVSFFRDPDVHALLVHAQETALPAERERLYARAQELIHELAPWVPLAHAQLAVAARDDLRGLVINPAGYVHYKNARRARAPLPAAERAPGQGAAP